MKAKDIVKKEISKFREKARQKRREADMWDKKADDLEEEIRNDDGTF